LFSKYPSAKPDALRLLANRRSLIKSENEKTIIVKVLVTPVIPAVVLSGNPDLVRFLKAGYPIKAFGYDKSLLHDKRLLTSYSWN
jgi:hypothetical protein